MGDVPPPTRYPQTRLLAVVSANEFTDAYVVALAEVANLLLVTLDDGLCRKPWAERVVNPIRAREA